MARERSDPLPLTPGAGWALILVASHELWCLWAVSHELGRWRTVAEAIPDRPLREHALNSLLHKRGHAEGAALFSVLPTRRKRALVRLLVAYQTLWDYLDNVSECQAGEADGRQLHLALIEALDPSRPVSDYYVHHPWKDDGGYLRELVDACRCNCRALPSYSHVRPHVLAGVARCGAVQSINHDRDPARRDAALKAWAEKEPPDALGLTWFELAAGASAFMPYALLALGAESSVDENDIAKAATYSLWVSLTVSMLDSYADQVTDAASGDHSYTSHYGDADVAIQRLSVVISQTARQARGLRNGHRHATIIAAMIAVHLANDGVLTPDLREQTRTLVSAGGSLTRLLLPLVSMSYVGRPERPSMGPRRDARHSAQAGLPPGSQLPRAVQTFAIWVSPFTCLERYRDRYGSRFSVAMTSYPPQVYLSDIDDIQAMLAAPADVLHPGEGGATVEPLVGQDSFMVLDEGEHLAGRKAILPAFHAKVVQQQAELVSELAQRGVASWPRDEPFALHPRLRALTLETALRIIFRVPGHISDDRLDALRDGLLAMLAVTGSKALSQPMFRRGPERGIWRRFLRQRSEVDELIYEIIEERGACQGETDNVFDRLVAARNLDGSSMSPQQIRDNLMSTVLAGHETTAAQLAWAFQLLAHNPTVCDKLIDEIDAGCDEEYLTATVQEVLRHRSVFVFAIPRTVKQPMDLGGWIYQPPTQLLGCIYLLHHDARLYADPHKFRPERFLEAPPHPHAWLPWGGGRKRCPGSHLATLEMKTVLRTVLSVMSVRPAAKRLERPRWRSVIVTPHAGSRVVLHERRRGSRNGASRRYASSVG